MNFRPSPGLVAVHRLKAESIRRFFGDLAEGVVASGAVRSPGFFIARVVALPSAPPPDLELGSKVLVEANSSPDGAPLLPPEWFDLPEGEEVVLVLCRRLPTPQLSEELAHRLKEVMKFRKEFPESKFPQHDPFWTSSKGESLLSQMGEHQFRIQSIKASRKGKGHDRLFKKGDSDFTLPDGILAVLED